jgi:hypothetical protein
MDLERSCTFAFKAPGAWGKLVLGGVFTALFFTVFFAFVVMGYLMRVLCDALEGRDATLPEWKGLGRLFNEGLMPMLISLAWAGPLIALAVVEQVLNVAANLSLGPLIQLPLALAWTVVMSVTLPVALIRFAIKGSMRSAFEIGRIVGFVRNNPGTYLTAWAIALVVGVMSGLGFIALGVGVFFTTFVANVVTVHLYAQAYRASTPFDDDQDGRLRSSMTIPPPLHKPGG